MRFLSLFSGIEAASMAWHPLGWECVGVSEIEPFPCALLAHHYPNVPNLGDVTKITESDIAALGRIDIVVFGSPCQDMSIAGKRKGLLNADGTVTRSGLFFNAFNIFQWARKHCGARFALWENVAGAYSSNQGRDFASVVSFMAGLDDLDVPANGWGAEGCALGDNGLLEWACLDAQWFGVAQRRRRVFAVLDIGDWANRPPILLERQSLRGDTAPSREAGQGVTHDIAPSLVSSGRGTERAGDTRGQDAVIACRMVAFGEYIVDGTASTMKQRDYKDATDLVAYSVALQGRDGGATAELGGDVAGTLRASGGGGDKAHVLAFSCKDNGRDATVDLSPTLRSMGHSGSHANGGGQMAVCISIGLDEEKNAMIGGDKPYVLAYGIPGNWIGRKPENGGNAVEPMRDVAPCQTSTDRHGVAYGMAVRRLTPMECERLQGFPDDYSLAPHRGKPAADGNRYKALGNSMAVPVMSWIGMRIQLAAEWQMEAAA